MEYRAGKNAGIQADRFNVRINGETDVVLHEFSFGSIDRSFFRSTEKQFFYLLFISGSGRIWEMFLISVRDTV
jgi:hypothetical protein